MAASDGGEKPPRPWADPLARSESVLATWGVIGLAQLLTGAVALWGVLGGAQFGAPGTESTLLVALVMSALGAACSLTLARRMARVRQDLRYRRDHWWVSLPKAARPRWPAVGLAGSVLVTLIALAVMAVLLWQSPAVILLPALQLVTLPLAIRTDEVSRDAAVHG